ncbi:MAG: SPOR domain-containing protein [Geminicoccaceae bacterium]
MSNVQGGSGFGFSREQAAAAGRPERIEHRRPRPKETVTVPPMIDDYPPNSARLPWVWLSIGILIGVGSTLMASALWLRNDIYEPAIASSSDAVIDRPLTDQAALATSEARSLRVEGDDATGVDRTEQGGPFVSADTPEGVRPQLVSETRATGIDLAGIGETTAGDLPRVQPLDAGHRESFATANGGTEQATHVPSPRGVTDRIETAKLTPARSPDDVAGETVASGRRATRPIAEVAKVETPDKPAGTTGNYHVQLAAVDDERAARSYWRDVQQRFPALFSEMIPVLDRKTIDRRVYFRIWVGRFETLTDANEYCLQLKTMGQDCFPTRG